MPYRVTGTEDYYDSEGTIWLFTVSISDRLCVDVKLMCSTGLMYIMQCEDGSEVYHRVSGASEPNYEFDRERVIETVRCYYDAKGLAMKDVINTLNQKIKQLGRYGFAFGECCKKGIVCSCGKLSDNALCRYCCPSEAESPSKADEQEKS